MWTLRLRASLSVFVATLALLIASLRAPALGFEQVGVTPVATAGSCRESTPRIVAKSVRLGRVPVARPMRGEQPRPIRGEGGLDPFGPTKRVVLVASTVAPSFASWPSPVGTWLPSAKTPAELMVFLN